MEIIIDGVVRQRYLVVSIVFGNKINSSKRTIAYDFFGKSYQRLIFIFYKQHSITYQLQNTLQNSTT